MRRVRHLGPRRRAARRARAPRRRASRVAPRRRAAARARRAGRRGRAAGRAAPSRRPGRGRAARRRRSRRPGRPRAIASAQTTPNPSRREGQTTHRRARVEPLELPPRDEAERVWGTRSRKRPVAGDDERQPARRLGELLDALLGREPAREEDVRRLRPASPSSGGISIPFGMTRDLARAEPRASSASALETAITTRAPRSSATGERPAPRGERHVRPVQRHDVRHTREERGAAVGSQCAWTRSAPSRDRSAPPAPSSRRSGGPPTAGGAARAGRRPPSASPKSGRRPARRPRPRPRGARSCSTASATKRPDVLDAGPRIGRGEDDDAHRPPDRMRAATRRRGGRRGASCPAAASVRRRPSSSDDLGLPAEDLPGARDVRLAHLRVVHGERLEDDLALATRSRG